MFFGFPLPPHLLPVVIFHSLNRVRRLLWCSRSATQIISAAVRNTSEISTQSGFHRFRRKGETKMRPEEVT